MTEPLRVLRVTGSEATTQVLIAQLQRSGRATAFRRVDSASALRQCLGEAEWDLVLCDYGLADFDAPAALAMVKELQLDIPFIIVSGAVTEQTAEAALRLVAPDCLSKDPLTRLVPVVERKQQTEASLMRMNEQMHALSLRLVEVQENERRFLARELHDEIGQVLTGLKLVLDMAVRRLPPQNQPSLAEAQRLVEELLARVRELSLDLRPQALDYLGLLAALECHFKRYESQTRVAVHFNKPDLPRRLAPDVETALYRIIQEALTNVARHAGVQEVWVKLAVEEPLIALVIEDQGGGFDATASSAKAASAGLSGMRERATLLNGLFEVESVPGRGTRLKAWLPLRWAEGKP